MRQRDITWGSIRSLKLRRGKPLRLRWVNTDSEMNVQYISAALWDNFKCVDSVMILAQRKVGWTLRYFYRDTSILFGLTDLGTFTQTGVRQHGYRICFEFIPWFVFLINRVKAWWTHTGLLTQTRTECMALTMVWYIAIFLSQSYTFGRIKHCCLESQCKWGFKLVRRITSEW